TTRMDKFMYVLLATPIVLGMWATVQNQILAGGHGYDYRETISPWLRSLFYFQPQPELMADVPFQFKLHIIAAFLLFLVWPFTRLVHAFSAPVGYTTRPLVVYRSRGSVSRGTRAPGRGWEPVGTPPDRKRRSTPTSTELCPGNNSALGGSPLPPSAELLRALRRARCPPCAERW